MGIELLFRLMVTKQFRFDKGTLWIGNTNLLILPVQFIAGLTKHFYKDNKLWKLYFISWVSGFYVVGKIVQNYKLDYPDKVYRFGMDFAELMGLGLYKTHHYDWKRYTYFEIPENPIIEFLKDEKINEPIDYFIAGAMAGGGSWVHQEPVQCIEMTCKIKGNSKCSFLTLTMDELKNRGLLEYAKKKYNLDTIYPLQKYLWENREEIIFKNKIKLLNKVLDSI